MSHLARFCPLEGVILGLQQEELRAEGVVMVASGDFEPPAWFRLSQVTCAESLSLSLPGTVLGSGRMVPALSSRPRVCAQQHVAGCLDFMLVLLFHLSLRGNTSRAFPKNVVEGIARPMWVVAQMAFQCPLSHLQALQNGLAAREGITSLHPRFHC